MPLQANSFQNFVSLPWKLDFIEITHLQPALARGGPELNNSQQMGASHIASSSVQCCSLFKDQGARRPMVLRENFCSSGALSIILFCFIFYFIFGTKVLFFVRE